VSHLSAATGDPFEVPIMRVLGSQIDLIAIRWLK
jgi:hypothetical protein